MKNYFILLISFAFFSSVNAQEVHREMFINPEQVEGICNLGEYGAIVAREGYRAKDDKELFSLHYLDKNIETQALELSRGSRYVDAESSSVQTAIVFRSDDAATIVYVKPGIAPKYATISTQGGYKHNGLYATQMTGNGELFLVRSYYKYHLDNKGREVITERGLEYINMDGDGEMVNRKMEKSVDGTNYRLSNIFDTPEGMVYHLEAYSEKIKGYTSKVMLRNASGDVAWEYELKKGEQTFFPSDLIYDNGKFVMAGDYLSGNAYSAKETDGLFLTILNETGQEQGQNLFNWDNLKQTLKDTKRSSFMFNGKVNILVEKIENNGSGYSIIGESYTKGGGRTAEQVVLGDKQDNGLVITVLDFVLFETDMTGNLTSVQILEKEKCNIKMNGVYKYKRIKQLSSLLKKYKVFPFKSFDKGTITFINYKSGVGTLSEMNASTGAVTEISPVDIDITMAEAVEGDDDKTVEESSVLREANGLNKNLDAMDSKLEKWGKKLDYSISAIDLEFYRSGLANQGLFFMDNGKVLSYVIDIETYSVYHGYLN